MLSGALTPLGHRLMARVYFADTDFSGVVYHARYLEFLERGRSDYLRLSGIHHTELVGLPEATRPTMDAFYFCDTGIASERSLEAGLRQTLTARA